VGQGVYVCIVLVSVQKLFMVLSGFNGRLAGNNYGCSVVWRNNEW